jgi:hypothetical protein
MTEDPTNIKTKLLAEVEQAWNTLNGKLDGYTEGQLSEPRDDAGWAAKDHMVHMAMWERSVIFLFKRQPRHLGLGVERELYNSGDEDAVNDVIFKQHAGLTAAEAREKLRTTHQELIAVLEPLEDADLTRRFNEYLPEDADDDRPAVNVVYGNTVHHYPDHMGWIDTLIKREQG